MWEHFGKSLLLLFTVKTYIIHISEDYEQHYKAFYVGDA